MKQFTFEKIHWQHRYNHGGVLRNKRAGRKARPLSTKDPLHLVFKTDKANVKSLRISRRYSLVLKLIYKYSRKYFVKIEQVSIQSDHVHLLIRIAKRSKAQSFLKVVAGQVAQNFRRQQSKAVTGTKRFWKYRPFTRVIKGWKAYKTVQNYIQLNELEAQGHIPYRKQRLRGLKEHEWALFWV